MKRKNTFFIFILTLTFLLPLLSFEVIANGPPSAELEGVVELPAAMGILFLVLLSVPGIVVTILSEWLIAGMFGMEHRELKSVCWVNLISQILMRIVFVFLCGVWNQSYLISIVVLEIAVYMLEFLVYRRLIKSFSVKKVLIYTITANSVSWLLGWLVNDLSLIANITGGM